MGWSTERSKHVPSAWKYAYDLAWGEIAPWGSLITGDKSKLYPKQKKNLQEEWEAVLRTAGKDGEVECGVRAADWKGWALPRATPCLLDWTAAGTSESRGSGLTSREKGWQAALARGPWLSDLWDCTLDKECFQRETWMFLLDSGVMCYEKMGLVVSGHCHFLQVRARVAQRHTPPLSIMLLPPLSLLSVPGFGGLTRLPMVFVFPRAPAIQCLTYATQRKYGTEAKWQLGQNFPDLSLYLDASYKEPEKFHYLGREITQMHFLRQWNFFAAQEVLSSQSQIPSLQSNASFGPNPGSYLHSSSYPEQPHSQANEAVFWVFKSPEISFWKLPTMPRGCMNVSEHLVKCMLWGYLRIDSFICLFPVSCLKSEEEKVTCGLFCFFPQRHTECTLIRR